MAVQGVLAAALPVVGRAHDRGDPRLRFYAPATAIGVSIVFAVAIAVASVIGPQTLTILLGSEFAMAGSLLAPALLAAGIMVAPTGLWHILMTRDRLWSGVVSGWVGTLALVVGLSPMVHAFGAQGVLFAAALGWVLRALVLTGWVFVTRPEGTQKR